MRVKDEAKREAIFEATIKLVNQIGLASASVSKIAKEAGVSPATIYIYFENKEELLTETYLLVKEQMGRSICVDLESSGPVASSFRTLWFNYHDYYRGHVDYFYFAEQFSNCPLVDKVDSDRALAFFAPALDVFERGRREGVIKDIPLEMVFAFALYPLTVLVKHSCQGTFDLNDEVLELVYQTAWEAIAQKK